MPRCLSLALLLCGLALTRAVTITPGAPIETGAGLWDVVQGNWGASTVFWQASKVFRLCARCSIWILIIDDLPILLSLFLAHAEGGHGLLDAAPVYDKAAGRRLLQVGTGEQGRLQAGQHPHCFAGHSLLLIMFALHCHPVQAGGPSLASVLAPAMEGAQTALTGTGRRLAQAETAMAAPVAEMMMTGRRLAQAETAMAAPVTETMMTGRRLAQAETAMAAPVTETMMTGRRLAQAETAMAAPVTEIMGTATMGGYGRRLAQAETAMAAPVTETMMTGRRLAQAETAMAAPVTEMMMTGRRLAQTETAMAAPVAEIVGTITTGGYGRRLA